MRTQHQTHLANYVLQQHFHFAHLVLQEQITKIVLHVIQQQVIELYPMEIVYAKMQIIIMRIQHQLIFSVYCAKKFNILFAISANQEITI